MALGLIVALSLFCILGLVPKQHRSSSTPWIGIAIILVVVYCIFFAGGGEEHAQSLQNVFGWIFAIYMIADLAVPLLQKKKKDAEVYKAVGQYNNKLRRLGLSEADQMDGHDFEYWCANLLRRNGFEQVSVTQGSGDQGVDILAWKHGDKYAIQCKRYNKSLGNRPVQEVNTGRVMYNCDYAAVMTNQYFTKSAKEAADATGVMLWDRDRIIEFLEATDDD